MKRKTLVIAVLLPVVVLSGLGGALYAALRAPTATTRHLPLAEAERLLLDASRAGEREIVEGLVTAGTPVDTRDDRGFTPLILAAYHGHDETVEALLALGAYPCAGDARGNTALMGAAFKGHGSIVSTLAAQPCAVDQANALGQTALMFARLFGRGDTARLLEVKGASAQRRDHSGRSAQDWAATQSDEALRSPVAPERDAPVPTSAR